MPLLAEEEELPLASLLLSTRLAARMAWDKYLPMALERVSRGLTLTGPVALFKSFSLLDLVIPLAVVEADKLS